MYRVVVEQSIKFIALEKKGISACNINSRPLVFGFHMHCLRISLIALNKFTTIGPPCAVKYYNYLNFVNSHIVFSLLE